MLLKSKRRKDEELRDRIAISVLPEIVREQGQLKHGYGGCENILEDNCYLAYRIADTMIEIKKKKNATKK